MGIFLRSVIDESNGDTLDYVWYCSASCYSDSFADSPERPTFEKGGAYPCGAEHDSPDFCGQCGRPVGNPLTPEGEAYVRDFVNVGEYSSEENRKAREVLYAEYSYLFS